jgi:CBS domain-containing protein
VRQAGRLGAGGDYPDGQAGHRRAAGDGRRRLVGILSERDYARKIILQGKHSAETRVAEIMTREVVTAHAGYDGAAGLAMMTNGFFRHLPVIEDGKVVGLVSIGDLVKAVIADQQATIEELERYVTT